MLIKMAKVKCLLEVTIQNYQSGQTKQCNIKPKGNRIAIYGQHELPRDVLSLNNSRVGDFVDNMYPIELEIEDTTYTYRYASYLDLHLEMDNEGRLRTKHYDNRDDFNFHIVNFHSYVATFQQHLHMEYISLSRYDILELIVHIRFSFIEGCC